ncbi:unnamed protein product [Sphenostylis stenocarpa]|uniref:Formiminotransferase N-terminal subdomain domain-containing protein n=1 Tax=Sphenostylis stenocarpa TaxID=92480 RepID=A0AA86VWR9_9FABA|nr:unnamed protein product [Sphenostylis stenocarpa]
MRAGPSSTHYLRNNRSSDGAVGIPTYENIVMEKIIAEIGFVLARAPKSAIYLTRVCRNAKTMANAYIVPVLPKRLPFDSCRFYSSSETTGSEDQSQHGFQLHRQGSKERRTPIHLTSSQKPATRSNPETVIVNKFHDRAYNRARYTLVSYVLHDCTGSAVYSPLHQTVIAMAEAAFNTINLESHDGAHHRLGVVDDIVFHPLARASIGEAAWLAKAVSADIGNRFSVPVFLYAAAHPTGKALDTIRRELGYYRPNFQGSQWAGTVSRAKGISLIGARPWVALYSVPIQCTDVSSARRIARKVSARGGGLPTVQTLALVHGEDYSEIACMLLEPNQIGADRVQHTVETLAALEGIDVEQGYFTDSSPEMIVEEYMKLITANRS